MLAAVIVGGLARVDVETGVDAFVPPGDETAEATDQVAASFGGDPVVVLLESEEPYHLLSGDQLPELLRLEGRLAGLRDVATLYGPATVLNQIAGQAQSLLAELSGYRDGLRAKAEKDASEAGRSKGAAAEAARGATADFDERYSQLLAQGLPGGLPTLSNEKFARTVIFNDDGEPRPQWDFVVPSENSVAILVRPESELRQDAVETLVGEVEDVVAEADLETSRVTVSGVPSIVAALGQQVRHEVPLLGGVALLGVGAWFLGTSWTRRRVRLLPLAATLAGTGVALAIAGWASIPVSLGVVAFLPVLLGVGSDFMIYLHRSVERRTVVVAALATAASFAALAVAPIPAVRDLGLTLAFGILMTLLVSLAIDRWSGLAHSPPVVRPPSGGPTPGTSRSAASPMVRAAAGVGAAAVALGGWLSLPGLDVSADFQSLASELPAFEDAKHVEDVIGSSGEVVVAVSGQDTMTQESLAWMSEARTALTVAHGDELRSILSPDALLGFLGDAPTADQVQAATRLLPQYLSTSVTRSDHQLSILEFGVRLDDARELQGLRSSMLEVLPPTPDGIEAQVTGLPMVAVSAYEALSSDRYLTAGLGIIAAGAVLLLGLRRRTDAVRAVFAAFLATGFVLLGIAAMGIGLNPLTAAVGSLAAAVACEFTVVLAEARRRHDVLLLRSVALAAAASATGYAVLALSNLRIIGDFGLVLAVTVGASILAAWIVSRLSERRVDVIGAVAEPTVSKEPVGAGR
ncbi:RND transporter [Aeromicrobium sp. CTD01-1L150]|uniref:RND transporter n=1 Tax=Aeromicrobium sp. CTD01-1L150 TaxID=3341830 RepID=UPI0035BF82B2